MSHYLAIDIGTEGARAAVYTGAGHPIGGGSATYPTSYPRPGWAEQDPQRWWVAAVEACRRALGEAGATKLDGISVATTASSVVVLDADQRPLMPAILWMDSRASAQSARTGEVAHDALRFCGGSDSSEWLVPKAMWLAENEPKIYAQSRYIGEAVDYLTLRLTGSWVGSRLNATCKWNYDSRSGRLPGDLYEMLGISDLVEKLPSDIRAVGSVAGTLSPAAATELGLDNRPVVGTGGIDAHLSLIPLSGIVANPVSIVAGTSNAFTAELLEPVFSPQLWGPYPHALSSNKWLVEGGQVSAGSSLTWLAERILGFDRAGVHALIEEAALVPPARHGLLILDNFMGNRTPLRDPRLRGAIAGLSLASTPAQLYCAAVESVAYGTRQVLDSFRDAGVDTQQVFLTGGIRRNPLWLQTTVDVLGRPINLVLDENLALCACAAIASVAAGEYSSLTDAAEPFRPRTTILEPRNKDSRVLEEAYELYRAATVATAELSHVLYEMSTGAAERMVVR